MPAHTVDPIGKNATVYFFKQRKKPPLLPLEIKEVLRYDMVLHETFEK